MMVKFLCVGVLSLLLVGSVAGACPLPQRSGDAKAAAAAAGESRAPEAAAGGGLNLRLVRIAQGLTAPVYITYAPGERGRLYVVEQSGRVKLIANGRVQPKPFLDISRLVKFGGERGLLSIAFHPNYKQNRRFFIDYVNLDGDTVVAEYRTRTKGRAPLRVRQLLLVDQPYTNHKGGQLQFGPDGLLYVGMGDGGSAGDPQNRAQNLSTRLGKLLRIDVDTKGADWEIVGYGLRNPWRYTFDRANGNLYIADVGQGEWEEIDFTPRNSPGLENYGWDVYEGTHPYEDKSPSGNGELVFPIHEYSHEEGCSVTGGYVYRGSNIPAAVGRYFFGDFCSGNIWSLVVSGGKATDIRQHTINVDSLSSFGQGRFGELYAVSLGGEIFRITAG
jgi:glucose/arabinose dehydrogenase